MSPIRTETEPAAGHRPTGSPGSPGYWPHHLPRELVVPQTSLWFNLEVSATRFPDKPAYVFLGAPLSFGELRRQSEALAGWLQHQGVGEGARVLVFMQNCPQYAVAVYGVIRANAVVVPVNPMNKAEEFRHYITDPQARIAICSAELAPVVEAANATLPVGERLEHILVARYADALPPRDVLAASLPIAPAMLDALYAPPPLPSGPGAPSARHHAWADAIGSGHRPGPHTSGPDDLALLPYTSGTTGLPKGCMLSHRNLMHNAAGSGPWGHAGPETVSLGVVPMFHITGNLYGLHAPIFNGSTVVLMPRWDRELAAALIARFGVTHWTCIPTMIIDLLGSPNAASFDLSSLRHLSGGGAAMPHAVAERLQRDFGLAFAEGYGLTETAAPSHGNPPQRAKLQCLGIPIFGVDSRIVDPVTLQELPVGEVGEIVTHGPMVFQGYWRQPEATRRAFVALPGDPSGKRFFRTGDLGRRDEEGYFFITDRLKRMINASGYKVWPAEVEALLFRHPAVQEACVISAQDPYRGETVKAVVVLRHDAIGRTSEQEIVAWAHEQMAAYKAPRIVEFVEALPKSGSGKVMWRLLQDRERGTHAPAEGAAAPG
jgi:fatty-acyl-CoA synthase